MSYIEGLIHIDDLFNILLVIKVMKEIMILPVNISGVENSRNEDMMSNFEIALTSYL